MDTERETAMERWTGKRNDEGFTLIELLVVIVILGILAAVVVFAVGGITDKGDTAASDTDKKTVQTAEEAFYAKTPSGSTAVYGTEKDLVDGKVLAQNSTKFDVCLAKTAATGGDKKAYLVIPQTAVPSTSTATTCANATTSTADGVGDWYAPVEAANP